MFGGQRSWIALACCYWVIRCFMYGSFCLPYFFSVKKFSFNIYYSLPATDFLVLISSSILSLLQIKDLRCFIFFLVQVLSCTLHGATSFCTAYNCGFSFSCSFIYSNFHVPLYISKTRIPHCSTWCASEYQVKTEFLLFLKNNRTREQTNKQTNKHLNVCLSVHHCICVQKKTN